MRIHASESEAPPATRLAGVQIDRTTGLHIGTVTVGVQELRVAIRPASGTVEASRRPLLMFNGIGANLELAGPLLARLGDGCESVIFDVPGAGRSPAPPRPYRLWSMARLAARLLDQLGYQQVDVMGVSWGGGLAQQFAIQYPERVRRLVLAATGMGLPMLPGRLPVLAKMVDPRRYVDKGYMARIAPHIYGGDMRTDPQAIHLFTDHMRGGNRQGYRYQLLAMAGWSSLPWLWRIHQPTLVLAGRDDPLVPLVNARLHALLLRQSKLVVIDDGHLFLLTRAGLVAKLVDEFLSTAA